MSASVSLPTAEQLMDGMARALKSHDFEAAVGLLRTLAVVDPASAKAICETIEALPAFRERTRRRRLRRHDAR